MLEKESTIRAGKLVFTVFGFFFLALGIIGIFLPLLPTTPFVLLAAYFFSRSSERFHRWLIDHEFFGPMIKDWQEYGAIPLKTKVIAISVISVSAFFIVTNSGIPVWGKVPALLILATGAVFVLTRPARPKS